VSKRLGPPTVGTSTVNMMFRREAGKRYEDTYGGWLELLKQVAEAGGCGMSEVPRSWYPFIRYLGGEADEIVRVFPEDMLDLAAPTDLRELVQQAIQAGRLRELVEHYSTLRPELADALYKSDVEWKTKIRLHQTQKTFNVTCNGSFYRPEVRDFLKALWAYEPPSHITGCVLVPCAADKPYPAPLHCAIHAFLPGNYHLIVATGVLGLAPEGLWDVMPEYDSGIPNKWRVMKTCQWFFRKHSDHYKHIIVYSDFYNEAIESGLSTAGRREDSTFVNPWSDEYINLLDPNRLLLLKDLFR
jgi:predicted RNA-binding protein